MGKKAPTLRWKVLYSSGEAYGLAFVTGRTEQEALDELHKFIKQEVHIDGITQVQDPVTPEKK